MSPPLVPSDEPTLRLAGILDERQRAEGSFVRLARAITDADQEAGGKPPISRDVIDRRKLQRIAENSTKITLSFRELVALDHYLEQFGQGLARYPILVRPTLLATLGESPEIKFLLGAKIAKRVKTGVPHSYLSRWDVSALREVQRELSRMGKGARTDFEDVILEDSRKAAAVSLRSAWTRALGATGPSLVCLGSPRACHAAEAMLARMFGLTALERTSVGDDGPPFHFVRPKTAGLGVPSALAVNGDDVRHLDPKLAGKIVAGKSWGLRIGEQLLPAEDGRVLTDTYGIIAAQRRPGNQVWIVLAGLSGPGTLAAARSLESIKVTLPEPSGARPASVLWAVVSATVKDERRRGLRKLLRYGLVGGTYRFDPPV